MLPALVSNDCSVVVMEDSEEVQNAIKAVLEGKLELHLNMVKNKEEAVEMLEKHQADCFIFDNWVGYKQEGLDALEQIREVNKTVFVAIFSNHGEFRDQAYALGCNLFVDKSPDLTNCIEQIAYEMLKYRLVCLETSRKRAASQIELITSPDKSDDRNIDEYRRLKLDLEWLKKHQGKYVAFVDGKCVRASDSSTSESRDELFDWLIGEKEYCDKPRLFTKVEGDVRIIDEPSSLWFD
jgi:DNA-binding NarL/FixJ family response regulator